MTHSRSSCRRGKGRFPPGSGNSPGLGEFTWECDSAQQLDLSKPQTRTLRWLQGPQLRGSGASPVSLKSSILQNSRSLCQNLHPKSSFRISVPCPAPLWTPHWVLPFVPMGFRAGVFRCFATPRFQVAPGQNQGEFHLHRWERIQPRHRACSQRGHPKVLLHLLEGKGDGKSRRYPKTTEGSSRQR